jgi:DNA-binding transcriptional LysR family regulator
MFHLRQLQCAVALAEAGSFGVAAERLGITPSGLTQSIQRLEQHYDAVLFMRSRTGVSLTATGEIVINGARLIVQRAASIEREVDLANNLETGVLNIGVDPTLSNAVLVPALLSLMKNYPRFKYCVTNAERKVLSDQLDRNEVDLFLSYPSRAISNNRHSSFSGSIKSPVLVCRSGHPLSRGAKRNIAEYFEYPRLGATLPEWYTEWAGLQLESGGLKTDPTQGYHLHADDLGLMKSIVQRTDCLMGLYVADAPLELEKGILVAINPDNWPEKVPIEIVYHGHRQLAHAAQKLVDTIATMI